MNRNHATSLAAGLVTTALLTGCGHMPSTADGLDCAPDVRGPITITYGVQNNKTIFEVKEKTSIKARSGLVFKLKPKTSGRAGIPEFRDATVTLKGKPTGDGKNDWFTAIDGSFNGTKGDDHKLGICAPDPDKTTTYEYMITIEGLGTLDPRVDVEK